MGGQPSSFIRSLRGRVVLGAIFWTLGLFTIGGVVLTHLMFRHPSAPTVFHRAFTNVEVLSVLAAVLMVVGLLQVRRGVSPIAQLRHRLSSVHEGRTTRVDGDFPSEVQPLVDDLNRLLAHHENAITRAQTKTGDLAHGLKTPRNERENILACLASLDKLIYPEGKLDVIIVDDASTDNTLKLASDFIHGKKHYRIIHLQENDQSVLKGKVRAMAEGIKLAFGEIILTTDADCVVNRFWAKTIVSYYTDNVSVVNGFTSQNVNSAFTGMQAIDFVYLLLISPGTINLGKPVSCIGNNMSFRKKAYE